MLLIEFLFFHPLYAIFTPHFGFLRPLLGLRPGTATLPCPLVTPLRSFDVIGLNLCNRSHRTLAHAAACPGENPAMAPIKFGYKLYANEEINVRYWETY